MKMNKALLVVLAVMGVSVSGPMVKWSLACGASPVMIAFGRMLLSGLLLLLPALRSGELKQVIRAPKRQVLLACSAGLLLAAHYTAWMTSLSFASTFVSTALVCTQPLFVAALSGLVLKERMPRAAIPGAAVAVIGALLIALNALLGGVSGDLTGALLALAGAIMMAGHWLCNRYARRTVEALPFMVLLYAQTALLLALTLPFLGGFRMTWMALLAVAGLAVGCTLLGHSMFTLALGKVSATVVSFAILGEPVGAMVWSFIMFGEKPPLLVFIGGVVTIAGLALYLMGTSGLLRRRSGNA